MQTGKAKLAKRQRKARLLTRPSSTLHIDRCAPVAGWLDGTTNVRLETSPSIWSIRLYRRARSTCENPEAGSINDGEMKPEHGRSRLEQSGAPLYIDSQDSMQPNHSFISILELVGSSAYNHINLSCTVSRNQYRACRKIRELVKAQVRAQWSL